VDLFHAGKNTVIFSKEEKKKKKKKKRALPSPYQQSDNAHVTSTKQRTDRGT